MGKKIKISVIILSGGDIIQKNYKKCLTSVGTFDEIIKIDTSKLKGSFSEWRNEGDRKSTGDWIFYVDSDEEVTNEVKEEIKTVVEDNNQKNAAFAIPRRNFIFGKEFKHGGQWPDYQVRLFKKEAFIKWEGNLHEQPKYKDELGYLKNPLIHHKDITVGQMIDKTNIWSEIEADLLFQSNHPKMNGFRFASVAIREFWLRFVKQLSFLDGREGIIYGIYQIYSKLITYSKLWERQLKA